MRLGLTSAFPLANNYISLIGSFNLERSNDMISHWILATPALSFFSFFRAVLDCDWWIDMKQVPDWSTHFFLDDPFCDSTRIACNSHQMHEGNPRKRS